MNTLKIGVHLIEARIVRRSGDSKNRNGVVLDSHESPVVDAELLDITPRFCRLRISRDKFPFDPAEVRIQFAWTDVVAPVIWTVTAEDSVELGLVLPDGYAG